MAVLRRMDPGVPGSAFGLLHKIPTFYALPFETLVGPPLPIYSLDPVTNFGKVTTSQGYGVTDVLIALTSGNGALLPNAGGTVGPFNLVWWNSTDYGDPSTDPYAEIVRCTSITGDNLTVSRGQEGTTASAKNISGKTYTLIEAPTAKTISDIQAMVKNWIALVQAQIAAQIAAIPVKRRIIFPAACFETRSGTSGWATFLQTQGTNFDFGELDYTAAAQIAYSPPFKMSGWNGGAVTIRLGWKSDTNTGAVTWQVSCLNVVSGAWDTSGFIATSFGAQTVPGTIQWYAEGTLVLPQFNSGLGATGSNIIKIARTDTPGPTTAILLVVELEYTVLS